MYKALNKAIQACDGTSYKGYTITNKTGNAAPYMVLKNGKPVAYVDSEKEAKETIEEMLRKQPKEVTWEVKLEYPDLTRNSIFVRARTEEEAKDKAQERKRAQERIISIVVSGK